MKRTILILMVCLTGFWAEAQTIESVPADKSVVYFVRTNNIGVFVNFTYFDGNKAIGIFNTPKYIRYECEPGEHVFWARAENRSFIKADLAPGKIYLVEATPIMGLMKTGVKLVPIDPRSKKIQRFQRLISNHEGQKQTKQKLERLNSRMKSVIKRGMKQLQGLERRNYKFKILSKEMYFKPEELILPKKKKIKKQKG